MSRLENLKMFERSISSKLTNVSFSLWWRLVISIIHWKNVLLDLAVPAHQRKCASFAQRKGESIVWVHWYTPAGIKLFE